ncbi:Homeobox protein HD-1 [Stylosanthes scabra]|uniref:Homeobox protein HD-1 n=1 Tax=Stylosanthes scabra TaxID=79078 RepID=A0ABU6YIX4_9FABA|nr:Homeobox protein HD-1 [Stylosanthes scabra]
MALLVSTLLNTKNGFVPLPNKLDDGNYYTWKKSVILTLRTLKLQDHFSSDKIPPQFETVPSPQADSGSVNKASGVESDPNAVAKKTHTSTSQILQESEKYTEWMQNDCALMTWLDASMSLSYQNRVVHCATFAEAWDTLTHIHSSSSATRIQSLKDQLRATKKTASEQGQNLGRDNSGNRGGRGAGGRTGRGGRFQGTRPQCQLCGKMGHVVQTCYHKYDPHFQSPGPSNSNSIPYSQSMPPPPPSSFHQPRNYFNAAPNTPDSTWYADSGASHHVTVEHSNILQHSDSAQGPEQLYVGNGKGVPILSSGYQGSTSTGQS